MRTEDIGTILVILLFISLFVAYSCRGVFVNENLAVKTLEAQGFTNITIKHHAYLFVGLRGCDSHDAARFTAVATNPIGERVEIIVCTGLWFKGGTIRVTRSCKYC